MSRRDHARAADARETKAERPADLSTLRNIYKDLPVGLCYLGTDLRYIHINDWLAEINGMPAEEHLGRTIGELLPNVAAEVEAQLRQVIDTGEPIIGESVEVETPAQPGIKRHFRASYYPVRSDDGEIIGISCVVEDVTARIEALAALRRAHDNLEERVAERTRELNREIQTRKQAEQVLQESENTVRLVTDSVPALIAYVDAEERYRFVNKPYSTSFALEPDDIIGRHIKDIIGEKLYERTLSKRNAVMLGKSQHYEEAMVDGEGKSRHIQVALVPQFGEGGGVLGYYAMIQDITQRKQAEEVAKASQARLANILDIAPDAVILVDQDQRIQLFNQGAQAIFGYAADEILGRPLDMLLPTRLRDVHDKHVEGFARSSESTLNMGERGEVVGLRKDGGEFPIEASISKLQQGRETVFTVMLRDITQRKLVEEAMRDAKQQAELANRAKSEFLANMSHELRTPLNAIIGFSDLIRVETFGPVGSPKYLEYAKHIYQSGTHLLDLINDILDLSKIEAGKVVFHEEAVDVAKAVRSCMHLVKARAETTGVNLKSEIADGLPRLYADERKLKQILINLLSNATKFTPAGGSVTVRAWSRPVDGYVFQVADTGIGIALEDIPKTLAPFEQIDSDLNRKYEGTGLGLPLTKTLVEQHGGSLDLQSKVNVGTTVTVRFPAERIMASLDNSDSLDVRDRAAS